MGDLRFAEIPVERKILGGRSAEITQSNNIGSYEDKKVSKIHWSARKAISLRLLRMPRYTPDYSRLRYEANGSHEGLPTSTLPPLALQTPLLLPDIAIVVDPPQPILGRLVAKVASLSSKSSINQTAAEWIRFSPIGVSFKTKRKGEEGGTAQV
jgi:hypothetical protein